MAPVIHIPQLLTPPLRHPLSASPFFMQLSRQHRSFMKPEGNYTYNGKSVSRTTNLTGTGPLSVMEMRKLLEEVRQKILEFCRSYEVCSQNHSFL